MKQLKLITGIYIFLFFNLHIFSQPVIQWSKCYGGTKGEGANTIISTSDGGYLIIGSTTSCDSDVVGTHCAFDSLSNSWYNSLEVWVIKIDLTGNLMWQKCLGGYAVDDGISVVETNGGYVLACTSGSYDGDVLFNNGDTDFWIVKIDFSGNIIWEHSYGGTAEEDVYGMAKTPDGGFVISGYESSINTGDVNGHHGPSGTDSWLIKIDSLGILQWQKCLGGTQGELNQFVQTDSIGNIYYISMTGSNNGDVSCNVNGHNAWLVKMDPIGNILWDNCFGGTGGQFINSIVIKDSKILLSGKTASSDGDLSHNYGYYDAWILLTDTSGNKIFSQSYGGSRTDVMYDAAFSDDDKIIACGSTLSNDYDVSFNHSINSSTDCWVICVDTVGNLLWEKSYGGSRGDEAKSIISLTANKFIFAGGTSSPNDGDVIGYHGTIGGQYWIVQSDISSEINKVEIQNNFTIYPQPFSSFFNIDLHLNSERSKKVISISFYDLQGRMINSDIIFEENKIRITPQNNINPGIYILEIVTNEGVYDVKVIKM